MPACATHLSNRLTNGSPIDEAAQLERRGGSRPAWTTGERTDVHGSFAWRRNTEDELIVLAFELHVNAPVELSAGNDRWCSRANGAFRSRGVLRTLGTAYMMAAVRDCTPATSGPG